ncbi:MAG: hypothetical protein H6538_04345 [Bacteroidales bacterium]|nr:hypothetical protein [Bacteroidales bacterium]MCB8999864.1 hypothetical protein [Bacteroidales bacterium]
MKKGILLILIASAFLFNSFSQTAGDKPAMVFENMYIMPRQGMEDKFEAAIKAHDTKFHPDGPNKAGLRKIEYGDMAGWYVWVFGPTTYAGLDTRPAKEGGHAADWSSTVDPLVATYGSTQLWEFNDKLSTGMDVMKSDKYYEVWSIKLKPGQYYRFKALAEKLKKTYETMGNTSFLVYNNPIHTAKQGDVALLWSFKSYADWAADHGTMEAFQKIYGPQSWQNMLDEWQDMVDSYDTEVRSILK